MKEQRGNIRGSVFNLNYKTYDFCLYAGECGELDEKQIEAARKTIVRILKRTGILRIHVYPNVNLTKKPSEVRMGKGKGNFHKKIKRIKSGLVLFSLSGVSDLLAQESFKKCAHKLPIGCYFWNKEKQLDLKL